MIDLAHLRANAALYKKAAKDKGIAIDIDAFLALDLQRRSLIPLIEEMRGKQNAASKQMPGLKGAEKE